MEAATLGQSPFSRGRTVLAGGSAPHACPTATMRTWISASRRSGRAFSLFNGISQMIGPPKHAGVGGPPRSSSALDSRFKAGPA